MPEQEQGAGEAAEEISPSAEDAATAPPLNREQRRAQAKGKKASPGLGGSPTASNPQNMRPGNHGAGTGGRFQRKTGGK